MIEPTLRQLAIFRSVARLGSLTRAAEALDLGQPAVSQHVAALERALGARLIVRAGRGVRLSEAGQIAAEYGDRILRLSEQLQAEITALTGLSAGRLVVGAGQTPGDYLLPAVLGEFHRRYPGVSVELEIADTRRVTDWLMRHVYDLGFIGDRVEHPDLPLEPFVEDRVVLFVASGHPLARRTVVTLADVLEAGLIAREPGSATRATGERALVAAGMAPRFVMELGSNEAVKRAVLAGLGVGLTSIYALEVELQAARLRVLPVPEFDGRRMLYIARHRSAPLTAAQAAFLELARAVKETDLLRHLARRSGRHAPV
ncbi:MAG TPA: LysR family transcriptional regulator [Dehalococcoidia bacterium]|nr:LysR family transcriptional regulator [Dehalococcoidia bacterium]